MAERVTSRLDGREGAGYHGSREIMTRPRRMIPPAT